MYTNIAWLQKENQHIFHEYYDGAGEIRDARRQLRLLKDINILPLMMINLEN